MTAQAELPNEVALVTPGDWVSLRLPYTDAEAGQLLAELLARRPELEARREAVAQVLQGLEQASRAANCLWAGGTFLPLPGGPLPVTLLVNVVSRAAAGDPLDPAEAAASAGLLRRRNFSSDELDLPCGRALRTEWFQAAQLEGDDTAVISFFTQYFVTPDNGDALFVLTFTSPAVGVAGRLRELFAAIAASLEVR